eukprot:376100-Alexandrium_andersonii.AAC.1
MVRLAAARSNASTLPLGAKASSRGLRGPTRRRPELRRAAPEQATSFAHAEASSLGREGCAANLRRLAPRGSAAQRAVPPQRARLL